MTEEVKVNTTVQKPAFWTSEPKVDEHAERVEEILNEFAGKAPPTCAKILKFIAPLAGGVASCAKASWPIIYKGAVLAHQFYELIPTDLLWALFGLVLCFAGGLYPTLFAAIEAARLCGWERTQSAIEDIFAQGQKVLKAYKEDDKVDEDGDGKADVDQLSAKDLVQRKTHLLLTTVDPKVVNTALGGLYTSWLAIMATLKIQFAATIALALSIADALRNPGKWWVLPACYIVTPKPYHKWVPVILDWALKAVAMSIAWMIQRVISAAVSAVRGAKICVESLFAFARRRGFTLYGMVGMKVEDTYLDEILSYLLAALGFYTQFYFGFAVPFPINWLLWPFQAAENYIQWRLTYD